MAIVLASASPRRQELLQKITADFIVCPSGAKEDVPPGLTPRQTVEYLASLKAEDIAAERPEDVVIGADTLVAVDGRVLGKPRGRRECLEMLSSLSGRSHSVFTGVAVAAGGELTCFSQESLVTFYPLTRKEMEEYASLEEPYDKAGAYGIQGQGSLFVKGIQGDYFNIMGLPVAALYRHLRKRGIFPGQEEK